MHLAESVDTFYLNDQRDEYARLTETPLVMPNIWERVRPYNVQPQ